MSNLKILSKLGLIMSECDYIQKDARNKHGGYNYASERAIKEMVGGSLRRHGVLFQISTANSRVLTGTGTDKINNMIVVDATYTFWDIESGESITGTFEGYGQFRDDKGGYAAVTGLIKYILTSVLLIATGDDPESRPEPASGDSIESRVEPAPQKETEPPRDAILATTEQLDEIAYYYNDQMYWLSLSESGVDREKLDKAFERCGNLLKGTPTSAQAESALLWLRGPKKKGNE